MGSYIFIPVRESQELKTWFFLLTVKYISIYVYIPINIYIYIYLSIYVYIYVFVCVFPSFYSNDYFDKIVTWQYGQHVINLNLI